MWSRAGGLITQTKEWAIPLNIYASYKQTKKDDQNRNKKILNLFYPPNIACFYCIVSEVRVWQIWETVYGEAQSHPPHENPCRFFRPIPATSAEKNSVVPILRNATRNPTTTRLPVPFVVNILIEGKACSVTGLSTKDLKWGQWGRDLHPLAHPIVLQSNHEVTVRLSVNHLSKMNPKSSQKPRRPVSYIYDTGIPSKRRKTVETVSKTGIILPCMTWQRPLFQKWYAGSLDSRPQPLRSTWRLVLFWETLKLENYGTTTPARTTPDLIRTEEDLSRHVMTSWSIFANNVPTPNGWCPLVIVQIN